MVVVVVVISLRLIQGYDEKAVVYTSRRTTQIYKNSPILGCVGRQVPWSRRSWKSWMELENLSSDINDVRSFSCVVKFYLHLTRLYCFDDREIVNLNNVKPMSFYFGRMIPSLVLFSRWFGKHV